MSSAILYAAIVAIWIGVLVPRWLRHDHTRDGHLRLRRFSRQPDSRPDSGPHKGDVSARAGFSDDGRPRYTSFGGGGTAPAGQAAPDKAVAGSSGPSGLHGRDSVSHKYNSAYVSAPVSGKTNDMAQLSELEAPTPVRPYGWSAQEYLRQERVGRADPEAGRERAEQAGRERAEARRPSRSPRLDDAEQGAQGSGERPGAADSERRSRVVRERRRMLWMLLVLTAFAVGLAYLSLAAWWIVVPPAVLLLGYLRLLREAAHADAEARERAAAQARHAREAEAQRARAAEAQRAADAQRAAARLAAQAGTAPGTSGSAPVWTAGEPLSHAEIIDISERVGDQLYDQYADAKLRAVGD